MYLRSGKKRDLIKRCDVPWLSYNYDRGISLILATTSVEFLIKVNSFILNI